MATVRPPVKRINESFSAARSAWRAAQFAEIDNRYAAAKQSRHVSRSTDLNTGGVSADRHYDIELEYFRLVEIGRMLDRDDSIAGVAVTRLLGNVLQGGFTPNPQTGDGDVDELIKLLWNAHTSNPELIDSQGERNFAELSEVALRDVITAGDVLALPLNTLQIELIENHRLRTPHDLAGDAKNMTIHGVRLNGRRQRESYYITQDDISPLKPVSRKDVVEVSARDANGMRQILHLYYGKRITQTRGVTKFAACSDLCRMHNDVQFAKLVQQQSVSSWTMIRERQISFELPDNVTEASRYGTVEDPNRPGEFAPMQQMSPGQVYTTYPGETVKGFSPAVPNPTFFDHAESVQQLIAINLDLPRVLLMLDASETNFSGWRGALDQAKIQFRRFQQWFCGRFHQPIYRWLLDNWSDPRSPVADPMLVSLRERGIPIFECDWILPQWPYVQPLDDASADLLESRNALTSMRRVHNKRSAEWTVVSSEIVEDNGLIIDKAMAKAKELSAKHGMEVNWQYLAALPMPEGLQVSINANASGETPETSSSVSKKPGASNGE